MGLVYVILGHNYLGKLTVIMQKLLPVATLKVNLQNVFSHTSINTNAQYSMNYQLCIIVANKQLVVHSTIQWTTIINLDYWISTQRIMPLLFEESKVTKHLHIYVQALLKSILPVAPARSCASC